ncbi:MAG: DUF86 domain-containing protein [Methanoregula sp.]|nr:DUF86 domain-containing protein [Methanoregula sp.]
MSKREVTLYLTDIDDAISAIRSYTDGITYEDLLGDRKTRDAIILNFVVIGEAIKKIPPEVTESYPDVPWKEFAGMRDKMVHGYFSISDTILWETIRHDLAPLASAVKELLRK